MEYFVFIHNDREKEKLVASLPSLEMARATARRMANTDRIDGVVAALVCCQEEAGGEVRDLELWKRGAEEASGVPAE